MFSSNSSQVSQDAVFVEDVFSTYLYTGNGTGQTINNGIDESGKGALTWIKGRATAYDNYLFDTARGNGAWLISNTTAAQLVNTSTMPDFASNGFTLKTNTGTNASGQTYVSWTFRKQPKFFDVVTYTGDGTAGRTVSHNLGSVPGCIIIKRTDTTANWFVYHKDMDGGVGAKGYSANLNLTDPYARTSNTLNDTAPTATTITLGTNAMVNASGGTYVAYLFAHNAGGFGPSGTDSVISCGLTGAGGTTLGWEPQWVLIKDFQNFADWYIFDNMRGVATGGTDAVLFANASSAENSSTNWIDFNARGFSGGAADRIYIAIRRGPMKTPTSGTQVYQGITRTGNAAVTTVSANITPDTTWIMARTPNTWQAAKVFDRLLGAPFVYSNLTDAERTNATVYVKFDVQNGYTLGQDSGLYDINLSGTSYINWNFKRAPGFMDVVCYTGNGANRTLNHNLGVVPELMIVKARSIAGENWVVYHSALGATKAIILNSASASFTYSGDWNNTAPTSTLFTVGTDTSVNTNNATFVNYLFASCPGVSKVGSYTGTGTTKQIDCGFTSGARFVLIKRTDSTGDWYVWDSARGIVSGNDPYLLLNSTAAEVTTTDYVDTYSAGFEISSTAPAAINANGGSFIFFAVA